MDPNSLDQLIWQQCAGVRLQRERVGKTLAQLSCGDATIHPLSRRPGSISVVRLWSVELHDPNQDPSEKNTSD